MRGPIAGVKRRGPAWEKRRLVWGNYPFWLLYGWLQKGATADARKSLDACRTMAFAPKFEAAGPMDSQKSRLEAYAEMRAQLLASGRGLNAAGISTLPGSLDTQCAPVTLADGDGLAA